MDAAIPAWKTVQTDNDGNDGCMTGASLNGFRGFIKIPLSHFCEITSNGNAGPVISANAVVKQNQAILYRLSGRRESCGYDDVGGYVRFFERHANKRL